MVEAKENAIIELCIQKLSEIHGTSIHLNGKHPLGGGCINHAVKLDTTAGDYFLKWHATAPSDIFVKEGAGLEEMRSVANPYLRIPEVIWSKEADEWPGLLLIEYLADPTTHSGYDERLGRGPRCRSAPRPRRPTWSSSRRTTRKGRRWLQGRSMS
jgi:fructosamine-3-kinase